MSFRTPSDAALDASRFEDLLRSGAEHQACLRPQAVAKRQRILFLGNSYNPLSAACLQSLVELGYDNVVGFYDPFTKGTWRLIRDSVKSRGWGPVLRRAIHLTRCKTRMALRRVGFPLSGFSSLPEISRTFGLKTVRCGDPNSAEFVEQVRRLGVDLIVVALFTRILKRELTSIPRMGCVNVHPSLLPRYRGPEPFYWVLANRETTTGVTLHYMDEGIDSGDIIVQREVEVRPDDTEPTLRDRSARVITELLPEAIPLLLAGKAPRVQQDNSAASYYSFPARGASPSGRSDRVRAVPTVRAQKSISVPLDEGLEALDPLQDPRWGVFVEENARASVFHSVSWLDALRRTYGYQPVVYTTSPPGAPLQSGMVFCRVESRITGRRLVSLPFSDHCEPLVDNASDFERIFRHLRSRVASGEWKYVELRPASASPGLFSSQESLQPSKSHYLHTVDLRPQENELLRGFHESSVRRRIRRATSEGLLYESGRSEVLQREFYQLLVLTRRRHQMPPQPEKWFRNLVECMGDAVEIHVASRGDKPIAAILTLRFKKTVTYKYGASDSAYKQFGPMPFLLWRAMQGAKLKGAEAFDLGRTDHDDPGLIAFKDHWNGVRTVLNYWRFPTPDPGSLRRTASGLELAKTFFGILPTSALKLAGELLYRHIG